MNRTTLKHAFTFATAALCAGAVDGFAQTGQYLPANIASTPTALLAHQIQGEYFGVSAAGDTLGAWVVANANNSYTVSLLPGGLVTIPGQQHGGWGGTLRYTGTATWNSTTNAFAVSTAAGYTTTSITGSGYERVLHGTTNTGALFSLNRVHRRSPTLGLKPKPAWGDAVSWFDSAAAAANPASELAKWAQSNTTPQLNGGYLYRGVRTVATHGAGYLHLEVMQPFRPSATGQDRGNSGVYLHAKYEAQVLDSFGKALAVNEMGAIYSVKAAAINATLPPMNFQTYDIFFTPRTSGANGSTEGAAVMTVYLNGVLVQDATPVPITTEAGFSGSQLSPGNLFLQDHGNNVVFNNIWFVSSNAASHEALRQSIPFDSVLTHAGVVSIQRPARQARAIPRNALVPDRFFDVNGRRIGNVEDAALPALRAPVTETR